MGFTWEGERKPPFEQRIETLRWVAEAHPLPDIRDSHVAVILLGQGIRLGEPKGFNRVNRQCTLAAGFEAHNQANKKNSVDLYIVSKNADLMNEVLRRSFRYHEKISVIKNYGSGSTAAQAESLTDIMKNKKYDRTVLVVPSYHVLRAKRILEAYGIKIDEVKAAEDVWTNPRLGNNAEIIKEGILLAEQRFDPKQKIPAKIRKLIARSQS